MRRRIIIAAWFAFLLAVPRFALAHCPLCTAGAGAAALLAVGLGVNTMTAGVFVGAFAFALGLWLERLIPKKIPHQGFALAALSFFLTVLPLLPLMEGYSSIYLSLFGEYGSLFHRVYLVNRFLAGGIAGATIVFAAPFVSRILTVWRKNVQFPYQGIIITFVLLGLASLIIELVL